MATETSTTNADEQIEKKSNEEVGGGEKKVYDSAETGVVTAALDAPAAEELKEEKDNVSESQTISVNETAPDPVLSLPEAQPAAESTSKETPEEPEKEPAKNEEPEPVAETAEKSSESSEAHPPTQVDTGKEAENSELGSIEEEKPEHVADTEEEKPEETQNKEIVIDKADEKQAKTDEVSTLASESTDKPSESVDLKAESQPEKESTKQTDNSELGSTDTAAQVKETGEPEKEFTEKREEGHGEKVNVEETSAAISDEASDAVESDPTKESKEQKVLETEPKEQDKPQPVDTEVEKKNQDTEVAKKDVEETKPLKDEGSSATESAEKVTTEEEAPTGMVDSSPSEAEKVQVDELKTEEPNEPPSAVEVLSREVAEQVPRNQEAQADTREDGKDSSLPIPVAAQKVGADTETKDAAGRVVIEQTESNAVKAEQAIEEPGLDIRDGVPVADSKDVQAETKSGVKNEAFKEEPLESKTDVKEERSVETKGRDFEKVQAEDIVRTDEQNPKEPTQEGDNKTQTSEDNKEVPTKQKQSNNIFSKVKQSLAKAKKAITGKSPNSKTVSSDTKGDIRAK